MHKCIGCEDLTETKFCNISCENKYYNNLRKQKDYICKKCNQTIKGQNVYLRHLKKHKREETKQFEIIIKKCELCEEEFNATRTFYQDGITIKGETRFCNKKCARSFSTREKRKEINIKVSKKLKKHYTCEKCNRKFKKSQSYIAHVGHCGKEKRSSLTLEAITLGGKNGGLATKLKRLNDYKTLEWGELIKQYSIRTLKHHIILKEQNGKCGNCGINKWMDQTLILQLHHIDGNHKNMERQNLICLCPNCHSITNNFCFKGKKHTEKSKLKISKTLCQRAKLAS